MGFSILPKLPQPFVLERHRSDPKPPTWLLRTLPQRWLSLLASDAHQTKLLWWLVEVALVGVTGVEQDGAPVEFKQAPRREINGEWIEGGATGEFLDSLPLDVVAELGREVLARNKLDAANAGN